MVKGKTTVRNNTDPSAPPFFSEVKDRIAKR